VKVFPVDPAAGVDERLGDCASGRANGVSVRGERTKAGGSGVRVKLVVVESEEDRDVVLRDLYLRSYDKLVSLASLLVKPQEAAEEVVQEAFARTYAGWDRIEDKSHPYTYVRTTVINLSRHNMRRRAITRRHPPPPPGTAPGADVEAAASQLRRDIIAALQTLSTRQRECVVLRYYQGCSVAETATILGISEGSVKIHAHRGRAALAERLSGDTVADAGGAMFPATPVVKGQVT